MNFSDILLTVDYGRTLTAPDSSIPERNLQAHLGKQRLICMGDAQNDLTMLAGQTLPTAPVTVPLPTGSRMCAPVGKGPSRK